MENVTLRDASIALSATCKDVTDAPLAGVSIDSRTVAPGELFFAIRGDRYDGHDFVAQALDGGAAAAVVSRSARVAGSRPDAVGALLEVDDTVRALQDLAAWYRDRLDIDVVAVTGTNGKTTTKDMAAAVLSAELTTAKTEGNLNNHIGVPLTVLNFATSDEVAVVEMGMNHPGEIGRLAEIAAPRVGVVTNVAEGHLESMETLDAVADAKGELLDALPVDGVAILNADDHRVMGQAGRTVARVVTFGLGSSSDLRATSIGTPGTRNGVGSGVEFDIEGGGTGRLPVPGRHNVLNALAALAVGDVFGIDRGAALDALSSFETSPMRMRIERAGSRTLLNDAYNSNPGSLAAALETLVGIAGGGPTAAALGDMLELGVSSAAAHRESGRLAAELGVGRLLLFGARARDTRDGAIEGGMPPEMITIYEDKRALARELEGLPERDLVILVKGSRGMRMEEVVELLVKEAPAS